MAPALPVHKLIPGTNFLVDGFRHGGPENTYFLSHAHSDHYTGISERWELPVYCSEMTGKLIVHMLGVTPHLVRPLPMNLPQTIEGVEVTLVDANHCPGAVQLLFRLPTGERYVHCGDMRYCTAMKRDRQLQRFCGANAMFLDTTYCNPRHTFPPQAESVEYATSTIERMLQEDAAGGERRVYLISTYGIGKEHILLEVHKRTGLKLHVTERKLGVMHCLHLPGFDVDAMFTLDAAATPIHVMSWGFLGDTWPFFRPNYTNMEKYREDHGADKLVGFVPTGWTYEMKKNTFSVRTKGSCSVHLVPYSEHSSYTELREYVQFLRPHKVIPTVGVSDDGDGKKASAMLKHFRNLVDETASKQRFLSVFRRSDSTGCGGGIALTTADSAASDPPDAEDAVGEVDAAASGHEAAGCKDGEEPKGEDMDAEAEAVLSQLDKPEGAVCCSRSVLSKCQAAGEGQELPNGTHAVLEAEAADAAQKENGSQGQLQPGEVGCHDDSPKGVEEVANADDAGGSAVGDAAENGAASEVRAAAVRQVVAVLGEAVTLRQAELLVKATRNDPAAAINAFYDGSAAAATAAPGVSSLLLHSPLKRKPSAPATSKARKKPKPASVSGNQRSIASFFGSPNSAHQQPPAEASTAELLLAHGNIAAAAADLKVEACGNHAVKATQICRSAAAVVPSPPKEEAAPAASAATEVKVEVKVEPGSSQQQGSEVAAAVGGPERQISSPSGRPPGGGQVSSPEGSRADLLPKRSQRLRHGIAAFFGSGSGAAGSLESEPIDAAENMTSEAPTKPEPVVKAQLAADNANNKAAADAATDGTIFEEEVPAAAGKSSPEAAPRKPALQLPPAPIFSRAAAQQAQAAAEAADAPPADAVIRPIAGYDPVKHARWSRGQPTPYLHVANAFMAMDSTTKRLKISDAIANMFRSVLALSPEDMVAVAYLTLGKIGPEYEGLELSVGGSTVAGAVAEATGMSRARLREMYNELGDMGDVAHACRHTQGVLQQPAALTVPHVLRQLRTIAVQKGPGAARRRQQIVLGLIRGCRGAETKYLVRTLVQNLRVGANWRSVVGALARAVVIHREGVKATKTKLDAAVTRASEAFHLCPNLDVLVPALVEGGIEELEKRCILTPGVPLKPMLAKICEGVADAIAQLRSQSFLAEYKYDGTRAQIHMLPDGSVKIFSRNCEERTIAFPDVVQAMQDASAGGAESFVVDAELVAVDRADGNRLRAFQDLSTRARGEVTSAQVSVAVCIFIFDILYVSGRPLVHLPLRSRREAIPQAFPGMMSGFVELAHSEEISLEPAEQLDGADGAAGASGPADAAAVAAADGEVPAHAADLEEQTAAEQAPEMEPIVARLQQALLDAVAAGTEGLMLKRLDLEAAYQPSKRSESWIKLKKDYCEGLRDSLDLVPIGAWYGNGRKAGWFSPFLLAAWDPETETYQSVCRCISGFTDAFYTEATARFKAKQVPRKAYYTTDEQPDIWVEPTEVWEIRGADLTISPVHKAAVGHLHEHRGVSLRFPRFIRTRDDKRPEDATGPDFIVDLYNRQTRKFQAAK